MASELGTYQANVSRWIRGGPPPRLDVLIKIRRITGISIESWNDYSMPEAKDSGTDLRIPTARAS